MIRKSNDCTCNNMIFPFSALLHVYATCCSKNYHRLDYHSRDKYPWAFVALTIFYYEVIRTCCVVSETPDNSYPSVSSGSTFVEFSRLLVTEWLQYSLEGLVQLEGCIALNRTSNS